jgi:nicotinamidase/pyrazinamidase
MSLKVHLLVIDPQVDFMDRAGSSLKVPGATEDMKRLSALIKRVGKRLEDIHVTLDSHQVIDVGHPGFWRSQNGDRPSPFTIISNDDVKNRIWTPRNEKYRKRMLEYTSALEAGKNKYPAIVWPEHCITSTPGHNVQEDLRNALIDWARQEWANIDFVTKGANVFTEHYGALMAEVPDPNDPSTQLNTEFLNILSDADIVAVAGEALSHCVRATVNQIAEHIGPDHIKKFHILTDCTSPVPQDGNGPDFPAIARAWLAEMEKLGMKLTTSKNFLN